MANKVTVRKTTEPVFVECSWWDQEKCLLPELQGPQHEEFEASLQILFTSTDLKKKEKCVSFGPDCRVKPVLRIDDYTDEEYFSCWYTPEELAQVEDNMLDALEKLERKEAVDEVNDTFRGLETHTKSGVRNKGRSRTTAIETVVGAYCRQAKEVGKKLDEKEVAGAYKECNRANELTAYLNGLGDQVTVRDLDMSFNSESLRQRKAVRRCGFSLVIQAITEAR